MADQVSVVEELATVTTVIEKTELVISDVVANVAVVSERVDVSIEDNPINVAVINDKIGVSVNEQVVQLVISDAPSDVTVVQPEEELYDTEIDTSVANVTYVGQAAPGTAAASSLWRIKRITETNNGSSVDWADGTATFTHAWTDRLALTYGP
jgi:hypothetical protein